MKTVFVALGILSLAASPALAGKPKAKKSKKAAVEIEEAPRRLSDTLGLGLVIATPSGQAAPAEDPGDDATELAIDRAEAFDLSRLDRRATMPTGEAPVRIEAQPLTEAQVGQVVKWKRGRLEYCYRRLPAAQRTGGAIALRFVIEPDGKVASVAVGSDSARLSRCVEKAAKAWTFPAAEARTELEYPVVLQ